MLTIHPVIQSLSIVLSLYVFYLGVRRFRFLHLHQKAVFPWKRHVALGKVALGLLMAGMIGGLALVYVYWHGFIITGMHGKIGVLMAPFMIFGFLSGVHMNRKKKNGRLLPLVHGLNNLFVLVLCLIQIVSGLQVYRSFVLGG